MSNLWLNPEKALREGKKHDFTPEIKIKTVIISAFQVEVELLPESGFYLYMLNTWKSYKEAKA